MIAYLRNAYYRWRARRFDAIVATVVVCANCFEPFEQHPNKNCGIFNAHERTDDQ
jgi:hypothetical protein